MEQRPLRLGDLVDDYCPRERRVTNHAIVAIVNDGIRQTRCTACDTEHVFKGAKAPRRRKNADDEPDAPGSPVNDPGSGETVVAAVANANGSGNGTVPEQDEEAPAGPEDHAWFVHRPLIRAQLPRTENDPPPPRPIPEFTMHQRSGRGFRDGQGWSNRNGNANGNTNASGNGHGRSHGFRGAGRPPFGQGQGQDPGSGRPRRHGRKGPR
jgi:hypothetical protein